ncbi:uncharacterized protein BCR38DRAFT_238859 [Pseudomassariella vexata]|uniref:Zn(2)-C6 fungal-type domain-containing protein n=1 Tax=Pseudomassariella vexata TaxID=1141098 RepID=A0A1Y2DTA5_9PEZI|nr:uncharacterized protein BCR38DRAFT_238859 [Pseudomassariella vexata]ORY62384.1 hypothetical protein BCR38DRAFT_238859 [Pseudomassariella vexata]
MAEAQEQPQARPQPEEPSPNHGLPTVSSSLGNEPLLELSPSQPEATSTQVHTQPEPLAPAQAQAQAQAHVADHHQAQVKQEGEHNQQQLLRTEDDAEAPTRPLQGVVGSDPAENEAAEKLQAQAISPADAINSILTTSAPSTASTTASTTVATDTPPSSAVTNGAPAEHGQQNGSAPPLSPPSAMSNHPQHPGHPRQPMTYPNQTYAAPGMNAQYGYPNPAGQSADAYRGSPTAGSNPMSLPSYGQPVPGVPLPGNPYGLPPDAMGPRYALPPSDPRAVLAGGRHKKEIKRRTKTGCLTCRKRRIKCDETHPVCKNCQKSKRDCLGYDPIFKQQQQHPTNIQPAPNHPNPSASVPSNGPASATPSVPSHSAAYSNLPSVLSSNIKGEGVDYSSAIDPALEGVSATASTSTSHFPAINPLDPNTPRAPHIRGGGPSFVPFHDSASQTTTPNQRGTPAYSGYSAKMKVSELVALGGITPPQLPSSPSQEILDDIRNLYREIYGPGLENFLETKWFTNENAVNAVISHKGVTDLIAGFLGTLGDLNDAAAMNYSANLEFFIVWDLTCLAYSPETGFNTGPALPAEDDPLETRNRIAVLDTLLSGDYLEANPLLPPPAQGDYQRLRQYEFWHHLGEFLRIRDEPNVDMTPLRDQILGQMRNLLDGRENRDVLYSIAIMRALAPNFPPDFESTLPPHLDESDPKNKLAVARKFIQDESKVTGGTTNVVRRYAELASRAFIAPGGNVPRRPNGVL